MTVRQKILVVDDEPQIRRFMRNGLTTQGYDLVEAGTAAEALSMLQAERPDLIILDLGLPDQDGTAVITAIRRTYGTPIIVLSARSSEEDKIVALDNGADDYVAKPFSIGELLARIRAALRHRETREAEEPEMVIGHLCVDFSKRVVRMAGSEIHLSRKEYELLRLLLLNAGKVLTHHYLLRTVWGPNYIEQTQYLRVYMGQLRHKLEKNPAMPELILTEPGVGYRLKLPFDNF